MPVRPADVVVPITLLAVNIGPLNGVGTRTIISVGLVINAMISKFFRKLPVTPALDKT